MADLLVRDVHLGDSVSVDIVIREGLVESVGVPPAEWAGDHLDGHGRLALPGLVDGHAHLDKTLWGLPWRPHSADPGLAGLVANERSSRRDLPPVCDRAGALLDAYVANGTTLVRTHVDVDSDHGLAAVEGVIEVASARSDAIAVDHGLGVGSRADLVLVDAGCRAEAAVTHPRRSAVVKAGRIVATEKTEEPSR